jgi:hypothetical protein
MVVGYHRLTSVDVRHQPRKLKVATFRFLHSHAVQLAEAMIRPQRENVSFASNTYSRNNAASRPCGVIQSLGAAYSATKRDSFIRLESARSGRNVIRRVSR